MPDIDKLEWLLDIDEDKLKEFLDNDSKIVYERCGLETLINLQENLPSLKVYISRRPIERAKKYYIIEHFDGNNHKQLAAKLGCSEAFVYETLQAYRAARDGDEKVAPDLFAQNHPRPKSE